MAARRAPERHDDLCRWRMRIDDSRRLLTAEASGGQFSDYSFSNFGDLARQVDTSIAVRIRAGLLFVEWRDVVKPPT